MKTNQQQQMGEQSSDLVPQADSGSEVHSHHDKATAHNDGIEPHDDPSAISDNLLPEEDITLGTSNRGDRMIFLDNSGYMHGTKETMGWCCFKRSED